MKFLVFILIFLVGCSGFNLNDSNLVKNEIPARDYVDHFKTIGSFYLNSEDIVELKLNNDSINYLNSIYQRMIINNETLLKNSVKLNFHVINNAAPFAFSLPGGEVFFSTGLFTRYLKSEEIFLSAFSTEILRTNRNIYEKKIFIPLGFISTEKILQLVRLKTEIKKSVNEWSFIVLKRSGFDSSAYLNWIQVQNRNSLDFAMYLGDSVNISSEEQQFKSFMSKQGILGFEKRLNEANSSKAYYQLLNNINREMNETRTIRKNSSRRVI